MSNWLIPKISRQDLRPMLFVALIGAMVAAAYGIVHDQITFGISSEYFSEVKFKQFQYADFGFPDRIYVGIIGALASWWAGMAIAWFLGRKLIPNQPRKIAYQQIAIGFAIVIGIGILFGLGGYAYGIWRGPDADYSEWKFALQKYRINDIWAFVRVAYIHNASYLGGLLGLIIALCVIRPKKQTDDTNTTCQENQ